MSEHRHLYAVTYTRRWQDGFRRRCWLRCWVCQLRTGPFRSKGRALEAVDRERAARWQEMGR